MALHFWDFLRPRNGRTRRIEIETRELFESAQEYGIRNLCFETCINLIANAIGRCEFRTFRNGTEVFEREHYLWNVEPNVNQNSTAFIHQLIAKLYTNNEALVIAPRQRDGHDALVIADAWQQPKYYPTRQNEYRGVQVGEVTYDKTFRENDVLHLRLNNNNISGVIDALYQSYARLYSAAEKAYKWSNGQHWKVHVSQIANGGDNWVENFQKMIESQVKPFMESNGAILPEFDGYSYEQVGSGKGSTGTKSDTRDIKALFDDIFDFTAQGFLIPVPLIRGNVADSKDSVQRFMSDCIDPIVYQLQEEIVRKRYGYDQWSAGTYLKVDSSAIQHFDLFANAASVEKLVGSGAYTINEIRRAANQETINEPWADKHFMTLNIGGVNAAQLEG